MGQTIAPGSFESLVLGEPYCCFGVLGPTDRRTLNGILSDIWNLLKSQDYWAVSSVCQHLRMTLAERNVVLCIDYNLHGQYRGVHTVSTSLGEAQLPLGLPGWLGKAQLLQRGIHSHSLTYMC